MRQIYYKALENSINLLSKIMAVIKTPQVLLFYFFNLFLNAQQFTLLHLCPLVSMFFINNVLTKKTNFKFSN